MTLKVTRLGNDVRQVSESPRSGELQRKQAAAKANEGQIPNQVSNQIAQAEAAVISAVRTVGRITGTGAVEKIKDYKHAKELADKVADDVRSDKEGAGGAHNTLEGMAVKEHLTR